MVGRDRKEKVEEAGSGRRRRGEKVRPGEREKRGWEREKNRIHED